MPQLVMVLVALSLLLGCRQSSSRLPPTPSATTSVPPPEETTSRISEIAASTEPGKARCRTLPQALLKRDFGVADPGMVVGGTACIRHDLLRDRQGDYDPGMLVSRVCAMGENTAIVSFDITGKPNLADHGIAEALRQEFPTGQLRAVWAESTGGEVFCVLETDSQSMMSRLAYLSADRMSEFTRVLVFLEVSGA